MTLLQRWAGAGLLVLAPLATSAAELASPSDAFVQLDSLTLKLGELSLQVDPRVGGRIASLKHRGRELLFSSASADQGNNWGSTFWLSPQSLWGWPPIAAHDNEPYRVLTLDNSEVTLQSAASAQASITKRVALVEGDGEGVLLDYGILAERDFDEVAPWEITRVPRGGLVFYPVHADSVRVAMGEVRYSVDDQGMVWLDMSTDAPVREGKINANGREGWLAWVVDRQLYLKVYEPVSATRQASGEGDVEVYLSGTQPYIELEVQGAAQSLKRGQRLQWQVRWLLRDLPADLEVGRGSTELVDFVRQQLPSGSSEVVSRPPVF